MIFFSVCFESDMAKVTCDSLSQFNSVTVSIDS